ncbi:MAG TPA: hypothetical protein V6C63_19125 [Allocoleopsis sp.]
MLPIWAVVAIASQSNQKLNIAERSQDKSYFFLQIAANHQLM